MTFTTSYPAEPSRCNQRTREPAFKGPFSAATTKYARGGLQTVHSAARSVRCVRQTLQLAHCSCEIAPFNGRAQCPGTWFRSRTFLHCTSNLRGKKASQPTKAQTFPLPSESAVVEAKRSVGRGDRLQTERLSDSNAIPETRCAQESQNDANRARC